MYELNLYTDNRPRKSDLWTDYIRKDVLQQQKFCGHSFLMIQGKFGQDQ